MPNFITGVSSTQTDADSPINQTLMDTLRLDDVALDDELFEVYSGSVVQTDKVNQSSIAAASVGRGEMITGSEEQNTGAVGASPTTVILTFSSISTYGMWPSVKNALGAGTVYGYPHCAAADTAYVLKVSCTVATFGDTGYFKIMYVAASPPHWLGDIPTEDAPWLFLVRDTSTGKVVRAWVADDPPGYLRHVVPLIYPVPGRKSPHPPELRAALKRDPRAWLLRPDPFVDDLPTLPAGQEIVLVDPRVWLEEVEYLPAHGALTTWQADAPGLVARGADPAHLAVVETAMAQAAANEASAASVARDLLANEPEVRRQVAVHLASRERSMTARVQADVAFAGRLRKAAARDLVRCEAECSRFTDTITACVVELGRLAGGGKLGDAVPVPPEDAERAVALGPEIRRQAVAWLAAREAEQADVLPGERVAHVDADAVSALHAAAVVALAAEHEELEEARASVKEADAFTRAAQGAMAMVTDPVSVERRRVIATGKLEARLTRARLQQGRVPLHILLTQQARDTGRLDALLTHPAAASCVRCVGTDLGHPDRRSIPGLCGVFLPGDAGEAPRVRLLSR